METYLLQSSISVTMGVMFLRANRMIKMAKSTVIGALSKTADHGRPGGAATGAVPGRDQRQPKRQLVDTGSIGRGSWVARQVALFPEYWSVPESELEVIQVRLEQLELRRPRQWGACWLACLLWDQLKLDEFWADDCPRVGRYALGECAEDLGLLPTDRPRQ